MANSLIAKGARVRYDAEDFPKYYRQLRGLCLKSKGAWVLSKLVRNPITKFETRVTKLCTQITATSANTEAKTTQIDTTTTTTSPVKESKPTSGDEASAETTQTLQINTSKSLLTHAITAANTDLKYSQGKWTTAPSAPTDADLKADPEETAFQFNAEVIRADIGTPKIRETLEEELSAWITAEGIIYAITIETLVSAPQFIIATEGAGRAQLQHLIDLHQGHTKRATQTLIKIYHDFRYLTGPPPEGLSRYYQRLHELLHSMKEAKPNPLVRNQEEILHTYKSGLTRVKLFVDELRACEIGGYNLK